MDRTADPRKAARHPCCRVARHSPEMRGLRRWAACIGPLAPVHAIERTLEDVFFGCNSKRASPRRDRYGSHTQPVDDRIGERSGRPGVREYVHDQDEMTRALRTRERVDVRDIDNWIGNGARTGNVVGHDEISLAGWRGGC